MSAQELMPLEEIEEIAFANLCIAKPEWIDSLLATARAAHALKAENEKLRSVYNCARRVLRFEGVNAMEFTEALHDLDDEIDRVWMLETARIYE